MFAIIRTGGKQYKVQPDQILTIERLPGEAGEVISFDSVLMVGEGNATHLGHPFLEGSVVKAHILEQIRAEKVIVFKKKRRHNYRRKQGHRQNQSVIRIVEISGPNGLKASGKNSTPPKSSGGEKVSPKNSEQASVTKKETSPKKEAPAKASVKKEVKSAPKKAPPKA